MIRAYANLRQLPYHLRVAMGPKLASRLLQLCKPDELQEMQMAPSPVVKTENENATPRLSLADLLPKRIWTSRLLRLSAEEKISIEKGIEIFRDVARSSSDDEFYRLNHGIIPPYLAEMLAPEDRKAVIRFTVHRWGLNRQNTGLQFAKGTFRLAELKSPNIKFCDNHPGLFTLFC